MTKRHKPKVPINTRLLEIPRRIIEKYAGTGRGNKLLPNATVEDIAAANAEIAKLKVELNRLQNITLEPILPAAVKPIIPALDVKLPDLKPVTTKAQQQLMYIRRAAT